MQLATSQRGRGEDLEQEAEQHPRLGPQGRNIDLMNPSTGKRVLSRPSAFAAGRVKKPGDVPASSILRVQVRDVVQRQLDAYNSHDADAFLSCYAADVVIRHADGRVLMTGHDEMRARYQGLFDRYPDVTATVPHRIQVGDWVVDEEQVQLGDQLIHVVVGYRVQDELIQSVVMIRSDL